MPSACKAAAGACKVSFDSDEPQRSEIVKDQSQSSENYLLKRGRVFRDFSQFRV